MLGLLYWVAGYVTTAPWGQKFYFCGPLAPCEKGSKALEVSTTSSYISSLGMGAWKLIARNLQIWGKDCVVLRHL